MWLTFQETTEALGVSHRWMFKLLAHDEDRRAFLLRRRGLMSRKDSFGRWWFKFIPQQATSQRQEATSQPQELAS